MTHPGGLLGAAGDTIARSILAITGAGAMVWAVAVFPTFSTEMAVVDVAKAVTAGEIFKPDVLDAVDAQAENNAGWRVRSSALGRVSIIRLRKAENAIRTGDASQIDRNVTSLTRSIDAALLNAPSDPFLWLARFWLNNFANGLRPDHLRDLRMSYEIGPYEGWIVAKRNRLALAYYKVMPSDLAEMAISEFVGLVRWGFSGEAAEIAAGPARPLRSILFPRLKDLNIDQRRPFAQAIYGQDLDDVLVPGIAPPIPQIPMPVLPPGF